MRDKLIDDYKKFNASFKKEDNKAHMYAKFQEKEGDQLFSNRETYPMIIDEEEITYYVKFFYKNGQEKWILFKVNPSRFGQSCNLGSGKLDNSECIGMNREFMKFVVDALNEKCSITASEEVLELIKEGGRDV